MTARFKRDQIVKESGLLGIILSSGKVSFDIVWVGGSTSRYRYSTGRHIDLADESDLRSTYEVEHLRREVIKAREERRTGQRIKRGQVWPGGARRRKR